jgi:oxaloacetate decarboxylase gamma subunit
MDKAEFLEGITLMLIGMITVFVVLCLVVLMGGLMIRIVNRFAPNEVPGLSSSSTPTSALSHQQIAVLTAAVSVVTHGKGKVVSITKLSPQTR